MSDCQLYSKLLLSVCWSCSRVHVSTCQLSTCSVLRDVTPSSRLYWVLTLILKYLAISLNRNSPSRLSHLLCNVEVLPARFEQIVRIFKKYTWTRQKYLGWPHCITVSQCVTSHPTRGAASPWESPWTRQPPPPRWWSAQRRKWHHIISQSWYSPHLVPTQSPSSSSKMVLLWWASAKSSVRFLTFN